MKEAGRGFVPLAECRQARRVTVSSSAASRAPSRARVEGRKAEVKHRVERQIGDQTLAIETGFLAKQAAGSVLVSYGETVVRVAPATGTKSTS